MRSRFVMIAWCLTTIAGSASAQGSVADLKNTVAALYDQQAARWNEGDLVGFTGAFEKTLDIIFVGRSNVKGYDAVLANFRHYFPNREAMGHLTYSTVEVQPLDAKFMTSTAHFHLQRTAQGGGDLDGYFMVVLAKTSDGWKIVRDDSTTLPQSSSK